jgi:hypothetical protein
MSYFTEGEKRWIKRHTKKSLKELGKRKGINMKPAKTKPAKRNDNPIIGKLLKLKYRINDTARTEGGWSEDMSADKGYVMDLISDIRKHGFKTLAPEDGHCCNGLWRKYS